MPIKDVIYDVGMNNGDDTAYYLSLGFRTVAIEANPELVKQAKARFAREVASGRLIILNIGIADREGALCWILGRPLFEHCDDGPRNLPAIFQGSHRNFADAAGMVDADLRHSAIQIAAREADFPDRIPFNAATVPKGNTHFVDA
jgi:hypothetical protein